LRHGDGGPRAAGAQRISGRRKPHPDGQAEWTPQALGHRASHTRRDWPSPRPQGSRRGRKVARPDTILGWYRKLVARKFDGPKARRGPGRPRIRREVEQRIVRMAEENRSWGYQPQNSDPANLRAAIGRPRKSAKFEEASLLPVVTTRALRQP